MRAVMAAAVLAATLAGSGSALAAESARPAKFEDWLVAPTGGELQRFYPAQAQRIEVNGAVKLDCRVTAETLLEDCRVISEEPTELGFGVAALNLVPLVRMKAPSPDEVGEGLVRRTLTFNFRVPD